MKEAWLAVSIPILSFQLEADFKINAATVSLYDVQFHVGRTLILKANN